MFITEELIELGQESLSNIFDDYRVGYSKIVCAMKHCSDGNRFIGLDGVVRPFRRYIDVRRKTMYWCYGYIDN